ncbi:MAG: type II toxin-antitoxin system RelE/ParE family toxin [Chloroflexia bacterium]|nr:type II toxin-antitoxin system RelE/ParE family toxin [Chloroflexia bacterium]
MLVDDVVEWFTELPTRDADLVAAAIDLLEEHGPSLGRPLVDHVKASRHNNMKELRPGSSGRSEIRILFAFDPRRRAVLLIAGDKAGNWTRWYDDHIPIADDRYDKWLRTEL